MGVSPWFRASAALAFGAIAGWSQTISPSASFRVFPANAHTHIQSLSRSDDAAWALVREYGNRSTYAIRISPDGGIQRVLDNLSWDYAAICANPEAGFWLTTFDGKLEERDKLGRSVREWRIPPGSPQQVRTGEYIVTLAPGRFLQTNVSNGRTKSIPLAQGWVDASISAFDVLAENQVVAFSGVRGEFLTLRTDSGVQAGFSFATEALEFGRRMYQKQAQDSGLPMRSDGGKAGVPVASLMPGAGSDGMGKIFALMAPMKISSARVVQFEASGELAREFTLDLASPSGQGSFKPIRLVSIGKSLMLFSPDGFVKTYDLK